MGTETLWGSQVKSFRAKFNNSLASGLIPPAQAHGVRREQRRGSQSNLLPPPPPLVISQCAGLNPSEQGFEAKSIHWLCNCAPLCAGTCTIVCNRSSGFYNTITQHSTTGFWFRIFCNSPRLRADLGRELTDWRSADWRCNAASAIEKQLGSRTPGRERRVAAKGSNPEGPNTILKN